MRYGVCELARAGVRDVDAGNDPQAYERRIGKAAVGSAPQVLHSIFNEAELETGRGDKFLTFAFIVRTAGFLPLDIVFPQIP